MNNLPTSLVICDMHFFFGIPIACTNVSSIRAGDLSGSSQVVFEPAFLIFFVILFPIKSPVASEVFWIALLEAVLSASIAGFLCCQEAFVHT